MNNKPRQTLLFRIFSIFIISYAVIAVLVLITVHNRFKMRMIDDYTRMASGVTNLMADALDVDRIDEYIEKNYSLDEYKDILKYYYSLKENYPDIYYMYVYRFESPQSIDATVVIDLDEEYTDTPSQESIDWIGDTYVADDPFSKEIDIMFTEKKPLVHTVLTADNEFLLSFVRPIFNADGEYVCSACVDFLMDNAYSQEVHFLGRLMIILGAILITILIINIHFFHKYITRPLTQIGQCVDNFVYETEADRFENVQNLESLNITQNDEIGKLYESFLTSAKEGLYYMSNYNRVQGEIESKDKRIKQLSQSSYKDGLTHVNNKAAYLDKLSTINAEIQNGLTDIGAIMMDINNLKFVNDNYGHDAGDLYIRGCCKIICDIFKHSTVYRIGGDEFLILLSGIDFTNRKDLYQNATESFSRCLADENAKPWERYSASLGLAEYEEGNCYEDIVKKADVIMYRNKMMFQKEHGRYR